MLLLRVPPVHRKMTRLAAYYYHDVTSTVNSSVTLFYGLILSIYSMHTTKNGLLDLANLPAKSSVLYIAISSRPISDL